MNINHLYGTTPRHFSRAKNGAGFFRNVKAEGRLDAPAAPAPLLQAFLQNLYTLSVFLFLTGTVQVVRHFFPLVETVDNLLRSSRFSLLTQGSRNTGQGLATCPQHVSPRLVPNGRAGFTLIEMLIVLAIIGLLSAVMMTQYMKFDSQLLLRNLAYEIALEIREAQAYGVSVRGSGGGFSFPYGVNFTLGTTYRLFRETSTSLIDAPQYTSGTDQVISDFTIGRNNTISALCVGTGVDADCTHTELNVSFRRPEPDALFSPNSVPAASEVSIVIRSLRDTTAPPRTVRVSATGQISIE